MLPASGASKQRQKCLRMRSLTPRLHPSIEGVAIFSLQNTVTLFPPVASSPPDRLCRPSFVFSTHAQQINVSSGGPGVQVIKRQWVRHPDLEGVVFWKLLAGANLDTTRRPHRTVTCITSPPVNTHATVFGLNPAAR
ncbi:hypothetical protein JX266_001068 [Neoarthrinium moseri]|nr:hypothetical protein JX266_001068 [Neoarthrinium moseri]